MNGYPIFDFPITIRECHLDTFGHVNNAVYMEFFEMARWEMTSNAGYGIEKIRATGQGPTLLEATVRFRKELKLRTEVKIKSQLVSYERRIFVLKQWIETAEKQVHCEAEFKIALFDLNTRKLILPTPDWLRAMGVSV